MRGTAKTRRVLIASNHPLFAQGLRSLLQERHRTGVEVVGVVTGLEEALRALEQLDPDLIVVDYDDEFLNRDEFLARFVEGEKKLRVVLLSLLGGGEAIVYDRRTLAAAQIDDWLEEWTYADRTQTPDRGPAGGGNSQKPEANGRRSSMKHLIIAGILVVISTALIIASFGFVRILPPEASLQASSIDGLLWLEFGVIAFLFSLIVVFMVYSIVVFRRKRGDETDAVHRVGNNRLEIVWTLAPLLTVLYFSYLGGVSLAKVSRVMPEKLEVNVIASQWSWRFEYPDKNIVSTELVLPVGQETVLHLSSTDVIHSFWVPEFRVKQDALPGGDQFVRDLPITPTEIGDYKVRCAELCGLNHAYMLAPVRVVSQQDYDAWVQSQSQQANASPVERGRALAEQYGCLACHSTDGSQGVGPTWKGLYESQVPLESGQTVVADEQYLQESIRQPGAQIHAGFPNAMPANIADQLSDEQIADIIAFIESLK